MAYSNNVITAPVSIYDVQQALSTSANDVGRLCSHQNINPWAKCKPIIAANIIRPIDYSSAEQVTNYHCGLTIVHSTSSFNDFLAKVKSALTNSEYKYQNEYTAVKYDRPTGTMAAPFRLTDFNGYRVNSYIDYTIHDESAGGDGLPISSVYSKNIIIDLRGTPSDVTLPDDSPKLAYYTNFMSGGAQIAARENIHVLDLIHWQLRSGIVLANLRRGMLIMRQDDLNTFRWTSQKIPWETDSDWDDLFGSASGTSVWVVEFYTNVNYAGGNANMNGQFFCIPQFSYITTCLTNANFSGSYPECNPYTNKIDVLYRCDAPISTFDELYIELQIEYTSGYWDGKTTITVKNYSITDVRPSYDDVYIIDSTILGKYMRIRIYGKLSGSYIQKDFYYSESVIIQ